MQCPAAALMSSFYQDYKLLLLLRKILVCNSSDRYISRRNYSANARIEDNFLPNVSPTA